MGNQIIIEKLWTPSEQKVVKTEIEIESNLLYERIAVPVRNDVCNCSHIRGHERKELFEMRNECNNRRHRISLIVNGFVFSCIVLCPAYKLSPSIPTTNVCIDSFSFAFCAIFVHAEHHYVQLSIGREREIAIIDWLNVCMDRISRLIIFKNVWKTY